MFLRNGKLKSYDLLIRIRENYMYEYTKKNLNKRSEIKKYFVTNNNGLRYNNIPIYSSKKKYLKLTKPVGMITIKNSWNSNKF